MWDLAAHFPEIPDPGDVTDMLALYVCMLCFCVLGLSGARPVGVFPARVGADRTSLDMSLLRLLISLHRGKSRPTAI